MDKIERYRANYSNSLKTKFAIPRNAEGEVNDEVFRLARMLESHLAHYPFFVGVAPYGSKMKGYSVESSDIDISIFYDSSLATEEECKALKDTMNEFLSALNSTEEINITYDDLNAQKIGTFLVTGRATEYASNMAIGDFCGVAIGPQVEKYRKSIGDELRKLQKEKQEQVIDSIVAMAITRERTRFESIAKRIPSTDGQESAIIEARKRLLKARIIKLFSLSDPQDP